MDAKELGNKNYLAMHNLNDKYTRLAYYIKRHKIEPEFEKLIKDYLHESTNYVRFTNQIINELYKEENE